MTDADTAVVPASLAGRRIDQALAQMFPQYSRSRLKAWLEQGSIRIDGAQWRPKDPVAGGEHVELTPEAESQVTSRPEPVDFDVVFADEHLIVVNKPPGLVVHPGAGNTRGTLMNGLLHFDPALESLPRAGIVHRLDKDTSGLLVVGRTLAAHTELVRMLGERDIERHYRAVVVGVLTGGGTIDEAIGRHRGDRTRMSVQAGGRPAVTHYTVRTRYRAHTEVDVRLETGRTHQIRVHFAYRRHPLVGDPVYGGRLALPAGASDALIDALRGFRRQALHAAKLSFAHPATRESIELSAEPPADYRGLLDALEADA